ncbi:Uncharacterised protein [Vibrio cholerae]|nr:Uncharacterised protein [Vibrio cholerae]
MRERLLEIDVVVKTAVDGWTNRHFRIWVKLLQCMAKQVRT